MGQPEPSEQAEPRIKTLTVALTASEKADVVFLAAFRRVPESDLMRHMTMAEIQAEVARIRALERVS